MSTAKKFSFKEAIAALKTTLGFTDIPAAADPAVADAEKDYTTDSGTKLKIDKLEIGGIVYLEDGTTPVTSGFTLSDGTTVDVDDKGMIIEVAVPGADPAPDSAPAPDVAAMVATQMAAVEQKITTKFTAQLEAEKTAREKDAVKFSTVMQQMLAIVEKFAEEPADDPAQAPTNTPPAESKKERGARLLMAAQESAKAKG